MVNSNIKIGMMESMLSENPTLPNLSHSESTRRVNMSSQEQSGPITESTPSTSHLSEFLPLKVPFLAHNEGLVFRGFKKSTLRKEPLLPEDRIGLFYLGKKKFYIINLGEKTVEECGGKDKVWELEAFSSCGGPKFQSTVDFLEGNRKLYFHRISESVDELLKYK